MSTGDRIQAQLIKLKMSRAELARRVGITPATVRFLILGRNRSSTYLHRIAGALGTTASYLEGEIDDSRPDALPPPAKPVVQHMSLPVALPAEHLIAAALENVIAAARAADEDDLARRLAKALPTILHLPHHALWHAPVGRVEIKEA